ncbi:MAG: hypothetical protein COB01_07425 [Lutibacter sp.]|nr:MAG: hypothetical protein COB01_07425 [Lutibacter sp.]
MRNNKYIKVKCIEVKQPIGIFYIATIEWYDINNIARADIRRIEKGEGGKVETYLGMQRRLSDSRVKEISRYVRNIDATFPTGIILHINSYSRYDDGEDNVEEFRNVIFDKDKSEMQIRVDDDVATILDGQHRIEGLKKGLGEKGLKTKFQLNVSIFVDLDMDNQSMVFATVNKAQTKVNKSLVYDLFAFANTRSPQRTAHNIVRLLDENEKSPFNKMVKILGTADDPDRETITQATIAESIIKYISKRPMSDRDNLKRKKKLDRAIGIDNKRLFFRNLFIDEKDAVIAKNIINLFSAVKQKWPDHWSNTLLTKSAGVITFMRFLRPAYLSLANEIGDVVGTDQFYELLSDVEIDGNSFNKENYPPGSSGQSKLYKELIEYTGLDDRITL